jgi:DNA-binding XRE family transcriptional regulator
MMTTSKHTRGARLREARRQRGLAIWALAVRAHTSPATIVAIERHGHVPTLDVRTRLAAALGIPVDAVWPNPPRTTE